MIARHGLTEVYSPPEGTSTTALYVTVDFEGRGALNEWHKICGLLFAWSSSVAWTVKIRFYALTLGASPHSRNDCYTCC